MSMIIIEYDPTISYEAKRIIEKCVEAEMSNDETSQYLIDFCIEELASYGLVPNDLQYLMNLADDDVHPRSYIEF